MELNTLKPAPGSKRARKRVCRGIGSGTGSGLGAGIGGGYFVWKSVKLYRVPSKENAMANFFASLVQLGLLIAGALLASAVRYWS